MPFCQNQIEIVYYFLINYIVVQKVWDKCDRWVAMSSIRHDTIVNHFQNFHVIGLNKYQNLVWRGV